MQVTPKDANVRTRVHEYGGAAHTLHPAGGVIYSDFKTQRLCWSKYEDAPPIALTPESEAFPDGRYRFADYKVTPSGDALVPESQAC